VSHSIVRVEFEHQAMLTRSYETTPMKPSAGSSYAHSVTALANTPFQDRRYT
jgi:hypothetical protein